LAGPTPADASDIDVNDLLSQLHPFNADKFLDARPATVADAPRYTLAVQTVAAGGMARNWEIQFFDPGNAQAVVAHEPSLDLWFEVPRKWAEMLEGNFQYKPGQAETESEHEKPKFQLPRRPVGVDGGAN
jgi:hypothetical protein